MRWYLWTAGSLIAGATFVTGCAWNRQETASKDAPTAAVAENGPLGSNKYQKLAEQFNGSGDDYEKKVRGLEEESWSDALKKAGSRVTRALTPKPKVTPAADPVSLASGIPDLGADVYYHAGQLAEEKNRPDEALRQYAKSLEKDSSYLPSLIASARLLERLGKREEAARVYQEAIRLHPESPAPYNDLGLSLSRRRQWKAAEAAFRRAAELAPKQPRYRNNLAMVLVEQERLDAALTELQGALPPAAAHYNLAFLLNKRGQVAAARQHLEQALKLDPSLQAARVMLAKLAAPPRPSPPAGAPATRVAAGPRASLASHPQAPSPAPPAAAPTAPPSSPTQNASLRMPTSMAPPATTRAPTPAATKRLPTVR